ncbi:DUF3618 domain-containing protein [Cryptosporangium aurantiacum]|uniref:DUF3618 domain-containing protein n=1 Tax=Cryptosporangium aurantiacum TaxID=134849 RepID=A0A1M7PBN1_9ACTN|nr:DUF3618 domain-containing protein [Cryptosporangium aurantiacum]SHN13936.1 Protein of unknown function [Cryptosporangium aurantiacum]
MTNSPTASPAPTDPDTIRAEIDETRADLGATVDALAAKTDIRGRVQARLADTRVQARQATARATITARGKAGPALEHTRVYTAKARQAATNTSPRTRAISAASAAAVLVLVLVGVRRRRRAVRTPWYRR